MEMAKKRYIALCDDEEYYREQLGELIQKYITEKELPFLMEKFSSGTELLSQVSEKGRQYDIIFLDVDMPEIRGMDVARKLRETDCQVVVCFITSYEQYALEAYQVEAMDYIVKPATAEKLDRLMQKALAWSKLQQEKEEAEKSFLRVKQKRDSKIINQDSILYVEKRRNQCIVFTDSEEMICYDTLQNVYEQLNQSKFVYAHQGYIVNFYQIKEIRYNTAFMGGGRAIPISRKYQTVLKSRFEEKLEHLRMKRYIRYN